MEHESRTASARARRGPGHESGSIKVAYVRIVNARFTLRGMLAWLLWGEKASWVKLET